MPFFSDAFKGLLNFIFPPQCPICKTRVQNVHTLCNECFGHIRFISKPYCDKCGRPFEFQITEEYLCGTCLTKKQIFHKARAVFKYDDFSKRLILPFKHSDHIELTALLTNLLFQAGSDLFAEIDILIPVPLHRYRLMKRKYNQAALLAKSLSHRIKKPFATGVLLRVKHTQSQGHMKRTQRQRNVSKAFQVKNNQKIIGKHVLLIDDVMTSGATLNECAKTLKKAGAQKISYLTLARVLKS